MLAIGAWCGSSLCSSLAFAHPFNDRRHKEPKHGYTVFRWIRHLYRSHCRLVRVFATCFRSSPTEPRYSIFTTPTSSKFFLGMDALAGFGFSQPLVFLTIIGQFAVRWHILEPDCETEKTAGPGVSDRQCYCSIAHDPRSGRSGRSSCCQCCRTEQAGGRAAGPYRCGHNPPRLVTITARRIHPRSGLRKTIALEVSDEKLMNSNVGQPRSDRSSSKVTWRHSYYVCAMHNQQQARLTIPRDDRLEAGVVGLKSAFNEAYKYAWITYVSILLLCHRRAHMSVKQARANFCHRLSCLSSPKGPEREVQVSTPLILHSTSAHLDVRSAATLSMHLWPRRIRIWKSNVPKRKPAKF